MAMLQIDGIGDVEVDNAFMKLTPQQQAVEVEAIASSVKASRGVTAEKPQQQFAPGTEEADFLQQANASRPAPDTLAKRGSVLPVGRTKEGDLTLAVPGGIEGPKNTVLDILEGRRTSDQITPREILEMGLLLGGAAGTGAGVARAVPEAATATRGVLGKVDDALFGQPKPASPPTAPVAAAEPSIATASTAELKDSARGFYKKADEAGVVLKPESIKPLADDIFQTLSKEGLDPTLHPRSTAALKRITEVSGEPLSLQSLETLRKVANAAGKGLDKDEGRLAGIVKDKIDDYVAKLSDKDVLTGIEGDAAKAAGFVTKARELWSKVQKLEMVEDLVERAASSAPNFSASGMENALRTEFRSASKNKRLMRTMTPQEQKAFKLAARGTVAQNVARNVGKAAPTGPVSGGFGMGAATLATASLGPIAGGIVAGTLIAGGFGARKLATILMQRRIKELEAIIRKGGDTEMATEALKRSKATVDKLMNAALVAAQSAEEARRKKVGAN